MVGGQWIHGCGYITSLDPLGGWFKIKLMDCGLRDACCCVAGQNNSVSPSDSLRAASEKHRGSSDYGLDNKKRKVDDKDSMSRYVSAPAIFSLSAAVEFETTLPARLCCIFST